MYIAYKSDKEIKGGQSMQSSNSFLMMLEKVKHLVEVAESLTDVVYISIEAGLVASTAEALTVTLPSYTVVTLENGVSIDVPEGHKLVIIGEGFNQIINREITFLHLYVYGNGVLATIVPRGAKQLELFEAGDFTSVMFYKQGTEVATRNLRVLSNPNETHVFDGTPLAITKSFLVTHKDEVFSSFNLAYVILGSADEDMLWNLTAANTHKFIEVLPFNVITQDLELTGETYEREAIASIDEYAPTSENAFDYGAFWDKPSHNNRIKFRLLDMRSIEQAVEKKLSDCLTSEDNQCELIEVELTRVQDRITYLLSRLTADDAARIAANKQEVLQ